MSKKLRNDATLRQAALAMPNRQLWDGFSLVTPGQVIDPEDLKGFTATLNSKGQIMFDQNGYRYYFWE